MLHRTHPLAGPWMPLSARLSVRPRIAAILLLALAASGCTASRPSLIPGSTSTETQLRSEVQRWHGTPHRWGGTSRSGVDCSGFVMRLFDELYGFRLPRTTEQQSSAGRPVSKNRLEPGDLVFFRISAKERHVGVYLDEGEFAHASSSQGVRISRLDETYWDERYWLSRRILGDSDALATTRELPRPPQNVSRASIPVDAPVNEPPTRLGW